MGENTGERKPVKPKDFEEERDYLAQMSGELRGRGSWHFATNRNDDMIVEEFEAPIQPRSRRNG